MALKVGTADLDDCYGGEGCAHEGIFAGLEVL